MINPIDLEHSYQEYIEHLHEYLPDGIVHVELELLRSLGLLNCKDLDGGDHDSLTHYYHVIETPEKITLFNNQFIIWIVPEVIHDHSTTFTFIARNNEAKPELEVVFSTSGVYNYPTLIVQLLNCFLQDIQENEEVLHNLQELP